MTGKLTAGADGRVTGPAAITHNDPWPCPNGDPGGMSVPHGVMGVLEHTMVGDLPGTVQVFNEPSFQASAHFGVDQEGNIHQFGPVNGWKAWHCAAGNPNWYGIEFADHGNPANPLTQAQITAGAQLAELLSRVGNFPLQITNSVSTEGFGVHRMGGAAFGGHSCPQLADGSGPRAGQRAQIIALAMSIRQGGAVTQPRQWTTAGMSSLAQLAKDQKTTAAVILQLTAQHSPSPLPAELAVYLNGVFGGTVDVAKPVPRGLTLYLPG